MLRLLILSYLIETLFARINSDKLTTKFSFYCFFTFHVIVGTSAAVSIFINIYCELIVMKIQVNPTKLKTLNCVCIFSPLNELIIFVNTDCLFFVVVKMTSYCLNPNLFLNLWVDFVRQSTITFFTNFSFRKILLHCFFGSSTSSYLCFLWSEWYFVLSSLKCLWSNPSSICFSFNHNILSWSCLSAYISHIYIVHSTEVWGFFISSFISYFLTTLFIENKFVMTNIWIN